MYSGILCFRVRHIYFLCDFFLNVGGRSLLSDWPTTRGMMIGYYSNGQIAIDQLESRSGILFILGMAHSCETATLCRQKG